MNDNSELDDYNFFDFINGIVSNLNNIIIISFIVFIPIIIYIFNLKVIYTAEIIIQPPPTSVMHKYSNINSIPLNTNIYFADEKLVIESTPENKMLIDKEYLFSSFNELISDTNKLERILTAKLDDEKKLNSFESNISLTDISTVIGRDFFMKSLVSFSSDEPNKSKDVLMDIVKIVEHETHQEIINMLNSYSIYINSDIKVSRLILEQEIEILKKYYLSSVSSRIHFLENHLRIAKSLGYENAQSELIGNNIMFMSDSGNDYEDRIMDLSTNQYYLNGVKSILEEIKNYQAILDEKDYKQNSRIKNLEIELNSRDSFLVSEKIETGIEILKAMQDTNYKIFTYNFSDIEVKANINKYLLSIITLICIIFVTIAVVLIYKAHRKYQNQS